MHYLSGFGKARNTRAMLSTIAIVAVTFALAVFVNAQSADAASLVVGSGGYSTITAAIQAASNGDTVRVHAGTYPEQVNVNKRLTLTAFGDGPVWVDGGCSRTYGISVTADNATIQHINVKRSDEGGVRVYHADGVTLDGLTIQDYNCSDIDAQYPAGVAVWDSSNLNLTSSTIVRRVAVSGSSYGSGDGVWIKNTSTSTGGGHHIAGNTIVGGYDGIGGEPEDVVYGGFYKNSTIEDNTVRDCWDDGIQVEGGDINVIVRDNLIDGCAIGIAFAPVVQGPLYIQGNTILDLEPGYYGSTYAFKIGDSSQGTTYLEDNVVTTQGDGLKQSNAGVGPIVSRRNIISVTRYVIEISSSIPGGTSFDDDCFWSTDPNRFVKWGGATYGSMSSFHSATGHESNGTESANCVLASTPSPTSPPPFSPTPSPTPVPTPPPTPTPTPPPTPTPTQPTTPTPTQPPTPTPTQPPTPSPSPVPVPGADHDGDGLPDELETACGSDPNNPYSRPEMIGGPFNGRDEDLDGKTDERIIGAGSADCDGDGFSADTEAHIYNPSNRGDQDPCGGAPAYPPYNTPLGWPADLSPLGVPNEVNILDLSSFVAPVRRLGTNLSHDPENRRWDLVPGRGPFSSDINILDMAALATLHPPMIDGGRAFAGPSCPWP